VCQVVINFRANDLSDHSRLYLSNSSIPILPLPATTRTRGMAAEINISVDNKKYLYIILDQRIYIYIEMYNIPVRYLDL